MPLASYASPAQRIGRIKGQILKHAIHTDTLEISGEVFKQPVKMGDTVVFRQVVPFGATAAAPNTFTTTAAANLIQEGVTPPAESITILDTTVQVQKYGALYGYTERQESLGEDDVPSWMEEQLGERLGLVRELVYIGAVQGGTNRFYSGGTTRATVSQPVTLNLVNRVTRSLAANHAVFMRGVLAPSANYGTSSVQKSYLAFGNTDLQQDIEAIPGYTAVKDYGSMKPAHEMEIGCVGSVRFILSPDMPKVIDAGAAIAGTTNLSTTGTGRRVPAVRDGQGRVGPHRLPRPGRVQVQPHPRVEGGQVRPDRRAWLLLGDVLRRRCRDQPRLDGAVRSRHQRAHLSVTGR
jgi:N4-gp56 family major capsid protein